MRFSSLQARCAAALVAVGATLALSAPSLADVIIPMNVANQDGAGEQIGQVSVRQT